MSNSPKILHIEDNFENRVLVRRILQANKFEVVEAEDATQALEILKTFQPDLILMDMNMPDIDGYTLTQQLRGYPQFEKTPILAITANVMKGDREKSLGAGCNGYIDKPIDIDKFIDKLNEFLKCN